MVGRNRIQGVEPGAQVAYLRFQSSGAFGTRLELLDSALHAPQAGFGDEEFYPEFVDKAAVLAVRIARNHPLPDGNKRLAWQALTMFCALNDYSLRVPADEAVASR